MTPQVLGIIPIRGTDPEVADGRMLSLGGKPLLSHTIDAAKAARRLTRTIVSTEDPAVAALAKSLGADVPFLRPAELSAPEAPLTKVLQHALLWLEEHEAYRADYVVLLEITHPLRPAGLIDRTIDVVIADNLDSAFVAREERHEFWTMNSHGSLERVQPREDLTRKGLQPLYKEMGGLVTVMRADLVRAGQRLGERVGLVPVRDPSSLLDLHDEGGLELTRILLESQERDAAGR